MRITSDFRDYYDGMAAHDHEPTPRYVRYVRVASLAHHPAEERALDAETLIPHTGDLAAILAEIQVHMRYGWGALPAFSLHVLAFCGRAYPMFELASVPRPRAFVFSSAQLAKLSREEELPRDTFADPMWAHWLDTPRALAARSFVALRTPVYLLTDRARLVFNPRLADIGFARVVPPPQAWQEIAMFLDNALVGTGVEPRPITDELKAHAHGFDQQSFRRAKGGRKVSDRGEW